VTGLATKFTHDEVYDATLNLAKEEKNIRTNPAARTTDLLRKVFGGK
jgi:chromosome condensin MukBEF MukE localization factor